MNTPFRRNRASRPAFTLVEIITVIAIIVALAAMTISGLSFAQKKAKVGRATVFVASVSQALEQYRSDAGVFPEGDGGADSTELVYAALSGDGEDGSDPDGVLDDGAQVYLDTLSPDTKGKTRNVRESSGGYVLVDAWKEEGGSQRQELYYRHDPNADPSSPNPSMMNPPSDFDLWSLGPVDPDKTAEEQEEDYIKNW